MVKGPVSGAEVCAYRATAAGKGDKIECVTTGSTGGYSMDIDYDGDVVIEASGGTYTDEATGKTATLEAPMQVVVKAGGGTVTGEITPLTSVAYNVAKGAAGGLTSAGFTTAATSVAAKFQLGTVNIATSKPTVGGTPDAYGKILRAVAQFRRPAASWRLSGFLGPGRAAGGFRRGVQQDQRHLGQLQLRRHHDHAADQAPVTGTASCGITVSGSGSVKHNGNTFPFTLPATKICITGLPTGSCEAGNAQLQDIAAAGATPGGDYSIKYSYSYAPGDCAGAIATVAYTQ
ncbi:hypothetical protein HK414_00475 [Ramlibacter terrae]|uniref:Uncharacterized protein n=1 Tax=Ramlibacter terrae TaxID=2732511 RepID=A0ABX6P0S3_9BURK|nr:hypothetical protein HK414_00475 [Ramlibacter terrae]